VLFSVPLNYSDDCVNFNIEKESAQGISLLDSTLRFDRFCIPLVRPDSCGGSVEEVSHNVHEGCFLLIPLLAAGAACRCWDRARLLWLKLRRVTLWGFFVDILLLLLLTVD